MMTNVPPDLKYSNSHEWVRVSGATGTVGITEFAQKELGEVVFVELPEVGRRLRGGEACAVAESVKTTTDIGSPVGGEVIATNAAVIADPSLVNREPYAGGWLFMVRLSNPAELGALLAPGDYAAQIGG